MFLFCPYGMAHGTLDKIKMMRKDESRFIKLRRCVMRIFFMAGYRSSVRAHKRFVNALCQRGCQVDAYDMPGHGAHPYGTRGHVYVLRTCREIIAALRSRTPTVIVGHSLGAVMLVVATALLRAVAPRAHRRIAVLHLVNPAFHTGHNVPWYIKFTGLAVGTLLPRLPLGTMDVNCISDHSRVRRYIREAVAAGEVYTGPMTAATALRIYLTGKLALALLPLVGVQVHLHVGVHDGVARMPASWYLRACPRVRVHTYDGMHDTLDRPIPAARIVLAVVWDAHRGSSADEVDATGNIAPEEG